MCQDEFLFHVEFYPSDLIFGICKLITEMKRGSPVMQQSLAKMLSVVNYNRHPQSLPTAIAYLLDSVKTDVSAFKSCRVGSLI